MSGFSVTHNVAIDNPSDVEWIDSDCAVGRSIRKLRMAYQSERIVLTIDRASLGESVVIEVEDGLGGASIFGQFIENVAAELIERRREHGWLEQGVDAWNAQEDKHR